MSSKDNKEFIRRYVEEVYNEQNLGRYLELIDEEMSAEAADHLRQFFAAFPDVHVTILDLISEGDKVVGRLQVSGTNTGSFAGQPPTGKKVTFHSIRIYRIVGGKLVESWAMQDRLGLMEQLGFVRAVGAVNWGAGENK